MGIKTNYQINKNIDTPGPTDYEKPEMLSGPAHLIGTGLWSDLGTGKSFLTPGVGDYIISKPLDGPKVWFPKEKKWYAEAI